MTSSGGAARLLDKFKGCMVGAVVGDCLGAPVECQFWFGIELDKVVKRFAKYHEKGRDPEEYKGTYQFTDDTAMARQLALSLVKEKGLDVPNLARAFVKGYVDEPWRGYGGSVADVFHKLENVLDAGDVDVSDIYHPATEQFNGQGSYGNGAAMRVHPAALIASDHKHCVDLAKRQAQITHSHPDAVAGAAMQALSTYCVLHQLPEKEMMSKLDELLFKNDAYSETLSKFPEFLGKNAKDTVASALPVLKNDIAASCSVPTALFSFLRARDQVPGLCQSNGFQRTMELAMMFGGDADTIMSMAGALAGAHYGLEGIPDHLKILCEGVLDAEEQAENLFKIHQENGAA